MYVVTTPEQSDIIMRDYDIIEADEALAIVLKHALSLAPRPVALLEALDLRVSAGHQRAEESSPPSRAALRTALPLSPPIRRIHAVSSAANRWIYRGLAGNPGTCVRITTGAPMPRWCRCGHHGRVYPGSQRHNHHAGTAPPGADVRPIGQDITRGQRVLEAGMRLGPQEIGLLASLGYTSLVTYPRPRVAVLATGDEIVEPDAQPRPGRSATVTAMPSWPRCSGRVPNRCRLALAVTARTNSPTKSRRAGHL